MNAKILLHLKGGHILLLIFSKWIPNLFTIVNLLSGVLAITFIMDDYIRMAVFFIFIAALMDFLDGRIARKLKVNSELGVELDSLADVVSFGVAPAILFNTLIDHTWVTTIAFLLYPTMGALRLARFNIKPTVGYFMGVPIPLAGLIIAGMGYFNYTNSYLTILLAILMVSPIRIKKL